jgi:hypothetical protein
MADLDGQEDSTGLATLICGPEINTRLGEPV